MYTSTVGKSAPERLPEVLKVMDEIGQFSAHVDFVAGRHHAFRQWPGPAAKHPDFAHLFRRKAHKLPHFDSPNSVAYITVPFLHEFQKRRHIRAAKVIDRFQPRENRRL